MPLTKEETDNTKWLSLGIAVLSLIASAFTFYMQSLREVHDFRAVDFGQGVLLINAGNRTETLASAAYLYGPPDWSPDKGGQLGKSTEVVVLKPGDAQVIHVPELPSTDLEQQLRAARHVAIQFLIVDTHSGHNSNKVFVETILGVTIVHELTPDEKKRMAAGASELSPGQLRLVSTGGSGPGSYDKSAYMDLYKGEHVE